MSDSKDQKFDPANFASYKEQAAKGDAVSQARVGYCYEKGLGGVNKNFRESKKYYELSAKQNHAEGLCGLGHYYLRGYEASKNDKNDMKEGIKLLQQSVTLGSSRGQNKLGICYQLGLIGPANPSQAVYYFKQAAEAGYSKAQYNLSVCYFQGRGVTQDNKESVRWCQAAAEQGHVDAQCDLGANYLNGILVPKDEQIACHWLRLAADQGAHLAQFLLANAYLLGNGIDKDEKEALRLYHLSAQSNNMLAQNVLGVLYQLGVKGVSQDYEKARHWYGLAAAQGHEESVNALAQLPGTPLPPTVPASSVGVPVSEEKVIEVPKKPSVTSVPRDEGPIKTRWIPDDERPKCKICDKEFGFFTRRHHCRYCGEVICANCSSINPKKQLRWCTKCRMTTPNTYAEREK